MASDMNWSVYLIECGDGSYYAGITTDLERRMKEHARGEGSKYVAGRGFKRLMASRSCRDRSEAAKLEAAVKKLPREKKIDFLRACPGGGRERQRRAFS